MKKYLYSILSVNLLFGLVMGSPVNNIDEDPWLRSWLFVGPFDNYELAQKASDSLSNASFDDIIEYCDRQKDKKDYTITSNSSTGRHAIYQYYQESNEDFVIGFCSIKSDNDGKAYYNQLLHPWDIISFYLDDELIVKKSPDSFNWKNVNVRNGTSRGRLIFQLEPDAISFYQNFRNDFSIGLFKQDFITTLKGTVTYNKIPVSEAIIDISTPTGLSFQMKSNESGKYEHKVINQKHIDELLVYCYKNKLKFSSVINISKNDNLYELNIALDEYNDTISGKVITLFEDKTQSDILVKLINISSNRVESKVFSDNSGKFTFSDIPKGKYQILTESDKESYYAEDEIGQKITIKIDRSDKVVDNLIIKAPQLNKGIWEQINFINGLKSDDVLDVHVDDENKIWFGCHTGLSVYDGNEYRNFAQKDGLRGTAIVQIFEDSKGLIWIIEKNQYNGQGGIKTIDKNYKIVNFLTLHGINEIGFNAIDEDDDGNIIFGGQNGLYVFDGKNVKKIKYGDGLGSGYITDIFIDNDNYWLGTTDGLVHFNGTNYNYYGRDEGLGFNTHIRKIFKSKKGDLFISTGHFSDFQRSQFTSSLYSYDGLSFNIIENANHTSDINDILYDSNIMIYNSGNKIILSNGNFHESISPYWSKNISVGFGVTSFEMTKDGNILIGTVGGGAWKYNAKSVKTLSGVDGMPDGWTWNMITDNENNIWICTRNGLIKTSGERILKKYFKSNGFPADWVSDLDLDNFGNIWASSNVGLINIVGDQVIVYDQKDGFENIQMSSISINSKGMIWVSGDDFISSFNGSKVNNYRSDIDSIRIYGGNAGLLALDNGDVLFGGTGLHLLSPDNEIAKVTPLTKSEWVNHISMDSNENIIYSSVNEGLVKFKDGKKVNIFNSDNGFIFDVPTCSYVDKNDWIWSASESGGVGFYDGSAWSYLNTEDGLFTNRINKITSDKNGVYYFSHIGGVTKYKPLKQKGYVSIDKVATTRSDLIKLDSEVIESIIYERIRIFLSARNHNNAQNKNKFKCSIIKNNSEVVTHIIDNPIFEWYPKNTGEYKFSVQSIDRDLNYSSPKVLTISILNPWYLRLNYLFPFLGFISLILYTTYSSTTRYLKQKQFNEKLRSEAQRKDKEAREVLEEKNKDLIESQKAAEAANEAKSTFLANMSHELRTPLNAIIGYSEMLIEDAEDENEDFIPDLDKINNSGKHLLGLINDILDLSKVESGKMELYLEEFDLQNTMSEIEATITPLVEKNSNTFKLEYETDVEKMKADVTKVRQILLNLLSNSSKFTKDGVIKVHVKDSDNIKQGVDFIIQDTGIGMSSDQVAKVFQPFTQADEKTTRKFGGTGLGLTITKMFAEMMGGMIDVSSVESEGTTFTVTLPRVVNDDSSTVQHTASERSDDKDYTVLVIDDDDSAQDMMKRFLEKQGYNVIQAKTGEMGLKLATEHMPDLITLDVMMPEMDGWEVLNTLQSNERSKKIPVIMLSMANEPDIGYSLGATDYLTKPVDWNELSTILLKHQIESDSQTVLIVEDDETTRQMLRKSLETNDYKVRSASNGKEGLEKVKQFKPGLILLDLMMPEMDGFEFAERLREKKEWLDIPVVVITAKDLSKEDLSRLKGNVETIMQKGSYSKDELLSEVGDRIKKLKGDRTS